MRKLFQFLFVFVFIPLINNGYSQDIKAFFQIDTTDIKIGEQVKAVLKIEADSSIDIKFSPINKFLSDHIEVVEHSEIDIQTVNQLKILRKTLILTSFDSGYQSIPPFSFILIKPDNSIDTVFSNPSFLNVSLISVDTLAAFKDIKEPIDTPFKNNELWSYLNYLLYAVIVIVLGLIGIQYYKMNKPRPRPIPPPPLTIEPPGVIAIRELTGLKEKKKWGTNEDLKDFYEEISLILRKYIQGRFKMQALERTSNEILGDMKSRALDKNSLEILNQILVSSDLVKYAKYIPTHDENTACLENAFLFVKRTRETLIEMKANA